MIPNEYDRSNIICSIFSPCIIYLTKLTSLSALPLVRTPLREYYNDGYNDNGYWKK